MLQTSFFTENGQLPDHENEDNKPIIGHAVINGIVSTHISICHVGSPFLGVVLVEIVVVGTSLITLKAMTKILTTNISLEFWFW